MKEIVLRNFIITEARSDDHFGYDFRSYIKIPAKGVYYFDIASDDGSRLFIDGKEIIDNDGSHSQEFVSGKGCARSRFPRDENTVLRGLYGTKPEDKDNG